mmetsp:Transcript_23304/g.37913  ORF Transcript_23304/g.37913 Transcript_23304/m.37913 type:complete len:302 (+) Transcript_23304:150-1055(+)
MLPGDTLIQHALNMLVVKLKKYMVEMSLILLFIRFLFFLIFFGLRIILFFFLLLFLFFLVIIFFGTERLDTLVLWENEVEGTKICRFIATILDLFFGCRFLPFLQHDISVFSLHSSCDDGGSDGSDRERSSGSVFKDFTRFQNGGASSNTFSLDYILHRGSDSLYLKATAQQLDSVSGRVVGDTDRVLKAVLAHWRIRLFVVVHRRHFDFEWSCKGAGRWFHWNINFTSSHVFISWKSRTSTCRFRRGRFSGTRSTSAALGTDSGSNTCSVVVIHTFDILAQLLAPNLFHFLACFLQCLFH